MYDLYQVRIGTASTYLILEMVNDSQNSHYYLDVVEPGSPYNPYLEGLGSYLRFPHYKHLFIVGKSWVATQTFPVRVVRAPWFRAKHPEITIIYTML